jgi:hypothetical protein
MHRSGDPVPINGISPDNPIFSTGMGCAHARVTDSANQSQTLELNDCMHAPDLPVRLFSVKQAAKQGFGIYFSPNPDESGTHPAGALHHPASGMSINFYLKENLYVFESAQVGFDSLYSSTNKLPDTVPTAYLGESPTDSEPSTAWRPFRLLRLGLTLAHARNNHSSINRTRRTHTATTGGPSIDSQEDIDPCSACTQGKMHHLTVPKHSTQKSEKRNSKFRLIHSDWWGPYPIPGSQGEQYVQVLLDDESGYAAMFCSARPDTGAQNLALFIAHLELVTNAECEVRIVQSDSATVYTAGEFAALCKDKAIVQRFSAPYSQAQNGKAERIWRTMENQVACMFAYSHLVPIRFWTFAVNYFVHVHNRTCAANQSKTPYELLTGHKPDIAHFRTWGCPTFAFVEKTEHDKFEPKAKYSVNLGPNPSTKDGYYIYFPDTDSYKTTRNVAFDEMWRARAEYYQMIQSAAPNGSLFPPTVQANPPSASPPPTVPFQHVAPAAVAPGLAADPPAQQHVPPPVPHVPHHTPPPNTDTPAQPAADRAPHRQLPPGRLDFGNPGLEDGPNTNDNNSRLTPVTPHNDTFDVQSVRPSMESSLGPSAKSRYHTEWSPSYNITQAAIDARTSLTGLDIPYKIVHKSPSPYGSDTYDVIWKSSIEPASTFLQEDGTYLPVFQDMQLTSRDSRAARREQRAAATVAASTGAFMAARATFLPVFALFIANSISSSADNMYHSSPMEMHDLNPRFHSLPHSTMHISYISDPNPEHTYSTLFDHFQRSELFAFVSVVLPSGATPKNVDQALSSVDARHWRYALDAEYDQLVKALTWELVPRNEASNVVTGKWIFKIKRNEDGSIDRYKARWVARGFSQRHDIDYTEIFAPVIKYSSVRMLLSLSNAYGLHTYGLDVSNAFARADMDEVLHTEQPHGKVQYDCYGRPYVCRLNKALYGTKQAARLWNRKFRKFLLQDGWRQLESDPCIYTRHTTQHGWELLGLYVDDIIHSSRSTAAHTHLLEKCNVEFPTTSQGELTFILGMHVARDFATKTLNLDQTQAIIDFVEGCDIGSDYKSYPTPMDEQWKYGDDAAITDKALITEYRSKCGSIMYFSQCTRPDITFPIHRLCQHLATPNKHCFRALQRLICYLASTPHLGIQYTFGPSDTLRLEAYADSTYGTPAEYKARSQSGSVIYFGGGPVDWSSSVQPVVALSSAEAEFISAFHTARSIVYFRQLLEELMLKMTGATVIWEDNQAAIAMSKNPVQTKRNKHMLLKYHYLRDLVESNIIRLEYIETGDQVADILTKATPTRIFTHLVKFLVRPCRPKIDVRSSSSTTSASN